MESAIKVLNAWVTLEKLNAHVIDIRRLMFASGVQRKTVKRVLNSFNLLDKANGFSYLDRDKYRFVPALLKECLDTAAYKEKGREIYKETQERKNNPEKKVEIDREVFKQENKGYGLLDDLQALREKRERETLLAKIIEQPKEKME